MSTPAPQLQEPPAALRQAFAGAGQGHVFRFWHELDAVERETLVAELEKCDLGEISRLRMAPQAPPPRGARSPAEVLRLGEEPAFATRAAAAGAGSALLRAGKVGVFLVAGGQGSRLGIEGPKGCLPFGPISRKSLFQLHAEKIAALNERHRVRIPWYIMTSPANDAETRRFFAGNRNFGLDGADIFFLPQRMVPALDDSGRLILETRGRLFQSPNGHGGAFAAFRDGGALADAEKRGIEHLFYFQVDNVLIRIADPEFLGLHALAGSEYSLKVLRKTGPGEKIGVIALEGGKPRIVEYSDLSAAEAEARDEAGGLRYWAGSIAIHAFTLDFFRRVAEGVIRLEYHRARKRIPAAGAGGQPAEVDGVKFETFIFDALPAAERSLAVEVRREEEFAPVKNRTGVDSVESAHALLVAEHRRWAREAGLNAESEIEIAPLAATSAEELGERLAPEHKRTYSRPIRIEREADGKARAREVEMAAVEAAS